MHVTITVTKKPCDPFQLSMSYVVLFEKDPFDGKYLDDAVVGYCESMQGDVLDKTDFHDCHGELS